MKKTLLIVGAALLSVGLQAQVGINTDETTLAPDAVLHVKNKTGESKGVLFPKMSTSERNNITNPTEGLMIYNTSYNCLQVYNGTSWSCSDGSHEETPPVVGGATANIGSIDPLQWFSLQYNGTDYNSPESMIPNNGSISVEIPYSNATNGEYEAYTQTFTLPDRNNVQRLFKLSYPAGTITQPTGHITATLTNISGYPYNPKGQQPDGLYHDLAAVPVRFNGTVATQFKVQATGGIPDKNFGYGFHDFVYLPVEVDYGNGVTKTWLNMNLGAEAAKVGSPHFNLNLVKTGDAAHQDANLYGSLYQWQRPAYGHEFRNSPTINTQADNWQAISPSGILGKFILDNGNWVSGGANASGTNLELWQVGGVNNPCPTGYHVPTHTEWEDFHEAVTGSRDYVSNADMFYQTLLPNFAAAGTRDRTYGLIHEDGNFGDYWSSESYSSDGAWLLQFNTGESTPNISVYRAFGLSVRCIQD